MGDPEGINSDLSPDEVGSLREPLRLWERALAIFIGAISGGGGAYAVFASSNQAGTAVLLVASVVFLLIGIQGTPLIRFASGSSSVELERRRRVQYALRQAGEEDNAERAEGIVQGLAIAEPRLVPAGALYQIRVAKAISNFGFRVISEPRVEGFDFLVQDHENRKVFVEAKYYREGAGKVPNLIVSQLLMKIGPPDDRSRYGRKVVLVSNVPLSRMSEELIAAEPNVIRFAIWRDERDNEEFRSVLVASVSGW